ncbi:MAG TPA: hypothetical protein IAB39_07590 [Candidatus Onthovicinus excrementipullorum]|nr:hypothetical protein [Candidatus Onthovicinus excrementipullorum]
MARVEWAKKLLPAAQHRYSVLKRSFGTSGIFDYCKGNGVTSFSYTALERGCCPGSMIQRVGETPLNVIHYWEKEMK